MLDTLCRLILGLARPTIHCQLVELFSKTGRTEYDWTLLSLMLIVGTLVTAGGRTLPD